MVSSRLLGAGSSSGAAACLCASFPLLLEADRSGTLVVPSALLVSFGFSLWCGLPPVLSGRAVDHKNNYFYLLSTNMVCDCNTLVTISLLPAIAYTVVMNESIWSRSFACSGTSTNTPGAKDV